MTRSSPPATRTDELTSTRLSDLGALAEAALLADLTVVIAVGFRLTPVAALGHIVAAIPMAVLAARRGRRALAIGGFVAIALTFLFAGLGQAGTALVSVLWGGVAGIAHRRGWSRGRAIVVSIVAGWSVVATLTLVWFSVFSELRAVAFESARTQWRGVATLLRTGRLDAVADRGDQLVDLAIDWWFVAVPLVQLGFSAFLALVVRRLGSPVLHRISRSFDRTDQWRPSPADDGRTTSTPHDGGAVAELLGVAVAGRLAPTDLVIRSGEVVAIVGANGAGKSTLLAVLERRLRPTSGEVRLRPGTSLGIIGQRPEAGVLGPTVGDDLAWGLADRDELVERIPTVADRLGLPPLDRETSALSGGELQRLVVAGVVLRGPSLVVSDESTAMLDAEGRVAVRSALRSLADDGAAVVHVTHLDDDLTIADRVVELRASRPEIGSLR